ncbi:Atrial natriuretic peptide receptor 2 [Taenia solium]|eukprot:TsM_000347500 transcript=TsM_000347500 gene=TsM_000347500
MVLGLHNAAATFQLPMKTTSPFLLLKYGDDDTGVDGMLPAASVVAFGSINMENVDADTDPWKAAEIRMKRRLSMQHNHIQEEQEKRHFRERRGLFNASIVCRMTGVCDGATCLSRRYAFAWPIVGITKGMGCPHSTSPRAHGRLKSINWLVSCRQVALQGTKPGDVRAFSIIVHEIFCQTKPYGPEDLPEVTHIRLCADTAEAYMRKSPVDLHSFQSRSTQFLLVYLLISLFKTDIPPAYTAVFEGAWSENPGLRPTFKGLNVEIRQYYSKGGIETGEEKKKGEKRPSHPAYATHLVAEALKAGVAVAPETYDEVSICISTIAGITTISVMSAPLQVVEPLRDSCTVLQNVCQLGRLRAFRMHTREKTKTILDKIGGCNLSIVGYLSLKEA